MVTSDTTTKSNLNAFAITLSSSKKDCFTPSHIPLLQFAMTNLIETVNRFSNLTSHISNLKSQISNLKSQISNLKSIQIHIGNSISTSISMFIFHSIHLAIFTQILSNHFPQNPITFTMNQFNRWKTKHNGFIQVFFNFE